MSNTRPRFSSYLATVLTMAGLAVGLGNVWRFPYMMGQHGGSAFLLVYLLFIILLAVPALSAEWALGRSTRSGPVTGFRKALGGRFGLLIGLVVVFSVFMALNYYNLVVANVFYSMGFSMNTGFSADTLEQYQTGLGTNGLQYMLALGVTLASLWIVYRGLRRGIEMVNKILVPLFAVIAIYLVVVALNLEGAWDAMKTFMKPDFSEVGPNVWFAAMGQACFSVGLSGALGVMYGSYLRQEEKLMPTALATGVMDTGAAIVASLFVVPAVLVFGLNMAAGPGLLFNTIPQLFSVMPGGSWLAPLFLASWGLVAILTIIGTTEAIIGGLSDFTAGKISRRQWIVIIGISQAAVMLPIAYNPHWIGTLDLIFGSGMFMLGSLLAVIGLGWGLGKAATLAEISPGLPQWMRGFMAFWLRYVVPLALSAILLGYIVSIITGGGH